ncbi:Deoxyribonuclease Tat-D [Trichoderma ghanense]|uniref:Deoxyribonuclease Tat-D n=1 Tax=Trichoderma ghanense TaxID=65468 RepID=A0ABY2H9L9_9HYPO
MSFILGRARLHLPRHCTAVISRFSSATSTMSAPRPSSEPASEPYKPRYIDIGINLADPIYRGKHRGVQRHPDDLKDVISRAKEVGCTKLIVTGSDFTSARDALELAKEFPGTCYATAGIHPCSSAIFCKGGHGRHDEHTTPCEPEGSEPAEHKGEPDPETSAKVIDELTTLLADARASSKHHLVAMGEFGLDYDRLHYCGKSAQLHSFEAQLKVAASLKPQLPLFLHSRAAHRDFVDLLKGAFGERLERLEKGGVVHSFTGTIEEMKELMDLGLHIGVNGCSLKTEENLTMVKEITLDRIMLETDGPWCEVRPSHAGYQYLIEKKPEPPATNGEPQPVDAAAQQQAKRPKKQKNQKKEPDVPSRFKVVKKEQWQQGAMIKGRNEPCTIERVAKIVAAVKGVSIEELCEASWRNTVKVFGLGEEAN